MGLIADIHNDLEKGAVRLISEYRARLMSDAIKLCKDASGAEDLVSRTLVKVINKIDSYNDNYDFYVWMKTILVNIHRNDQDRPVTRGTIPVEDGALEQYAGADWSTDEEILRNSDCEFLHEVLKHLDPADRETLLMRYYDGLSLKEIASFLNKPVSTIGRRIQVAVRLLSGKFGAEMRRAKKPLAVLGVLLLGAATLFGAYQLVEEVEKVEEVEEVEKVEEVEEVEKVVEVVEEGRSGILSASEKDEPSASVSQGGAAVPAAQNEKAISNNDQQTTTQQTHETQTQEKPTMKLTQTFAAAALAVTASVVTVEADGITLNVEKVQQRYPWNGLVDIDYTITYDSDVTPGADDALEVTLVDHGVTPAVTNRAITFLQAPLPLTEGPHRITWDAHADGVTNRTDKAEFIVEIANYSEAYMVIDVSGGSATNCYPVDFLNGVPQGGFNTPEYKGNKIVLRRIHPGSYMAGSPANEANRANTAVREKQHRVALSQPFYIGIFEITQQQYQNVMGENPSQYQGEDGVWQCRPVEKVSWYTVRGGTWPNGKPETNSFMDKLISKCKSKDPATGEYTVKVEGFDLPTEFQWEYACRAGTTGAFNTTNEYANTDSNSQEAQLKLLGRYSGNASEGVGGISTAHTIVGSYLPNAWGLYDMHGNVWEWCRDWYIEDPTTLNPKQYKEPVGAASGSDRVLRGGSWFDTVDYCRSAYRNHDTPSRVHAAVGFRLSRTLP